MWHRWHRSILQAVPRWLNPKVAKMDRNGRVGEDTGESSYEADCGMTNQLCSNPTGTLCSFREGLLQQEKWERASGRTGERARSGLIRLATEIDRPGDRSSVRWDARTHRAQWWYIRWRKMRFPTFWLRERICFLEFSGGTTDGGFRSSSDDKIKSITSGRIYMCHIVVHTFSLNSKFL